ncbi:MAG: hypothetical protein RIQ41_187 [Candidatus Parcubacteria bacterium]|jgi:mannosyltransferase OCH1-like enzyme
MAIPKIIHYCWFGKNDKGALIESCIASWKKHCPDFEIREWNETNFDTNSHPFTKRIYEEKRWAFVSDYARLKILHEEGGFYLDTDMLLLKDLSVFSSYDCVLGEEEPGLISAGMIGATQGHPFISESMKYYDTISQLETIPRILTKVFAGYENKNTIHVLPPKMFYPFDFHSIGKYHGQELGQGVYGVHMWNYSWGTPFARFMKKTPLYRTGVRATEMLGVKKILKKLLGFV